MANIGKELAEFFKQLSEVEIEEVKRVKVGTIGKSHLEEILKHLHEVEEVKQEIRDKRKDFEEEQKKERAEFEKRLYNQYLNTQDRVTAEKTTLFMLAAEGDEELQKALFADNSYVDWETGEVFLKLSKKEKVIGQVGSEMINKLSENEDAYESLENELKERLDEVTAGLKQEFYEKGRDLDKNQEEVWKEILGEIGYDGDVKADEYTVNRETGEVSKVVYE